MKVTVALVIIVILMHTSLFGMAQDTTKINLIQANTWEYNKAIGPDVQRIIGQVILNHDSSYLYCDSAYLNEVSNDVLAYGNVHIQASDTLNLFGDSLLYQGNTKVATIWGNVRLVDNQTILTTDTLVYDRKTQIARYDDWGKIVNDQNVLVSKHGYYYTDIKEFFFKTNVILLNPDYEMNCDTLRYNTFSEIAYFFGPATIVSKDKEDSIYCEYGWYDTQFDRARFLKEGKIYHLSQYLTGDTIYYERHEGFGEIWNHAFLFDTVQHVAITGNYGLIVRKQNYAFMTDSAVAILIDKKDSLFMHADTIWATFDSSDHIQHILAYDQVKFFRSDLQGAADSLAYHSADSTMFMYDEPVLWSEENQLTADTISLTMRNGALDSLVMYSNAFIISQDDTNKYNQIKGKNMTGYFRDNDLVKVKVNGNSETIYWVREEDKTLIGINKLYSSDMLIYIEQNKVQSITYLNQPSGTLYPEKDISPYDVTLKNFKWLDYRRPYCKEDIFLTTMPVDSTSSSE